MYSRKTDKYPEPRTDQVNQDIVKIQASRPKIVAVNSKFNSMLRDARDPQLDHAPKSGLDSRPSGLGSRDA